VTSLHSISMVTNYMAPCCRSSYVWYVKQIRRSKCTNKQAYSNRLALLSLDSQVRTQAANTSATTNYANISLYNSLTYNIASAKLYDHTQ